MHGERNLDTLLKTMQPQLADGKWVFRTSKSGFDVATLESAILMFREAEGMTIISPASTTDVGLPTWAMVTLSIENLQDGSITPSGWSTRKENGGDGKPFSFQPGVGLIEGWSKGVLQMREGERALIHVPPGMGYGPKAQGTKGAGWYIPGNSNLLFDIEIIGKAGTKAARAG